MLLEADRPDTRDRPCRVRRARTARCAPPVTRRSASSTTSATRRRSRRSTRAARPESRSSCSWSRMRAAGCRGFARTPSASTSTRWRGYETGERGSASPPTPCVPARLTGSRRSAATPPPKDCPLHVHADEQPREIEECLAEHGARPIEVLARTGCLGPQTTVVHATHASDAELDLLADAGARVCICPTTEANLGDGYAPVAALSDRGLAICIGSDSNIRIDPLEELRELEGIARRSSGRRNVVPVDALLRFGTDVGAAALGLESWPLAAVNLEHPSLDGVDARRCSRRARLRVRRRRLRLALGRHGCRFARPSRRSNALECARPVRRPAEVCALGRPSAEAVRTVIALERAHWPRCV